jgi:hypothetical protein
MKDIIIGIYKITSPSNKIYIGQSLNIKRRFKHYSNLNGIKSQSKIYHSLKKYGYENHIFEIIEECSVDELNVREEYWIRLYQSHVIGLNICEGGNSFGKCNRGKKRSEDIKNKISNTKKLNPKIFTPELIMKSRQSSTTSKKIFQYDLQGNFINEYPSINEAARQNGIRNDGISNCIRGKQNTAYNYQWFIEFQDKVNPIISRSKPERWVGNRNLKADNNLEEILHLYSIGYTISYISRKFKIHRDAIKKRIKDKI